jgi:hypothetical protein
MAHPSRARVGVSRGTGPPGQSAHPSRARVGCARCAIVGLSSAEKIPPAPLAYLLYSPHALIGRATGDQRFFYVSPHSAL